MSLSINIIFSCKKTRLLLNLWWCFFVTS